MILLFPYMARWNSANMSRYYHLFKKIADAGHTVIVVQPPPRKSEETNYIDIPMQNPRNLFLYTVDINTTVWNLAFPFDKFFKKALYTVISFFLIKKLVAQHKPDALIVYNLPQYLYTFIDVPVVFDYADDYIAMLEHELGISHNHIMSKLGNSLLHMLVKRSMAVMSVSEILYNKVDHKKKVLLPNGADMGSNTQSETILHIDKSKPVVGYVGAFEYFIDLDLMLNVARSLPNFTFLFVGAGREFKRIKNEVSSGNLSNVILTGAVPHRQTMQFVAEMDICLNLFNKGEVADAASPIKVFEYLAKRKPLITTRLSEIERIDKESQAFFYADTLDEVIQEIEFILDNPYIVDEKVNRGIELIKKEYNWDHLASIFVENIRWSSNSK